MTDKTFTQVKQEALELFNDAFGTEFTSASDIRDYLRSLKGENNNNLVARSNSKLFWLAVIDSIHTHLEAQNSDDVYSGDSDEHSTTEEQQGEEGSIISFSPIKVEGFYSDNVIEVTIGDESRLLRVEVSDDKKECLTTRKEVSVDCTHSNGSISFTVCKLAFHHNENTGELYAYPLSRHGGKVNFLYLDATTRYSRIKAYLSPNNPDFRYVDVDQKCQTPHMVRSDSFVICKNIEMPNMTLHYPMSACFERIGEKWTLAGGNRDIQWLSTTQNALSYRYKIGITCCLQNEYGSENASIWQITDVQYCKHLLQAKVMCIKGNHLWRIGEEHLLPVLQLIPHTLLDYTTEELEVLV